MDVLVFPQGWWIEVESDSCVFGVLVCTGSAAWYCIMSSASSVLQVSQLYCNTIESKGFHIQCKWLFVQAFMHRSAFGFAADVSTMRCCR